jgi:thioesterase domain-containing protein/acyl carrier protein
MSKPNIEAIYPLTFMQKALLFHHLQESEDQGLLHVQCKLNGQLDYDLFEQAWQDTVARHSALRTSLHWKEIDKPVQIIHRESAMPWDTKDWSDLSAVEQNAQFDALIKGKYDQGLDLSKSPISQMTLVRIDANAHYLLWNCHHIILDGWSATVILADVFSFYDAKTSGSATSLEPVPSYSEYLKWLQNLDLSRTEDYWKHVLNGYQLPELRFSKSEIKKTSEPEYHDYFFDLSEEITASLQTYARENHMTFSTVIEGIWSLLHSRNLNTQDITFGITVSGRSGSIDHIELMAGLFANVLPMRVAIEESIPVTEWLIALQKDQNEAQNYAHATLGQINTWIGWQGTRPLFDTLLVIENFPWNGLKGGDVSVTDFSGSLTSTYPLTVVVMPGKQCHISLRYDGHQINSELIEWYANNFISLAGSLASLPEATTSDLYYSLDSPSNAILSSSEKQLTHVNNPRNGNWADYVAPINNTELTLTKIWEEVLGQHPIGVTDNFFELGGRSIVAVRLFGLIEHRMQRHIPPASLLQHPTIRELARLFEDESDKEQWSSLVPLRASGSKTPIFCIHGGGAHVLFYRSLAHCLGQDQPVFGLQPVGLNGAESTHNSIEEMASYYVDIIRKVQPEGPYALLSTCFGIAVTLEMGRILERLGQVDSTLFMIDTAPPKFLISRKVISTSRFVKAMTSGQWSLVTTKIIGVAEELRYKATGIFANRHLRNIERMRANLAKMYEAYHWEPYGGEITFIRTSESKDNPDFEYQSELWARLTLGGLNEHIVPGFHRTLFEEPDVTKLAEQIKHSLETVKVQAL